MPREHHLCVAAILSVTLLLSGCASAWIDRSLNGVYTPDDDIVATHAVRDLHESLFIVDLHADTMLWNRDLLVEADYGHVDLPRLVEGNVAIQVFAIVTKAPLKSRAPPGSRLMNANAAKCIAEDDPNPVGWLQALQLRPFSTWFDLRARALHQAARLKQFAEASRERHVARPSEPYLMLIRDVGDLETLIDQRLRGVPAVGAVLAIEGAHWVGGGGMAVDKAVEELYDVGVRMVGPVHRFNNALAASSEGCDQFDGLTEDGHAFLAEAEKAGLVLDLAHLSDHGIQEATTGRAGPVVVSHTGARSTCRKTYSGTDCVYERNMRDEEIRSVARTGGVVALGYWPEATGRGLTQITQSLYAVYDALSTPAFVAEMRESEPDYNPLNHIALGSDFDGAVETPFDVGDLSRLTMSLLTFPSPHGTPPINPPALRHIYGLNACRVLASRLPGGGPKVAKRVCAPLMASGTDSGRIRRNQESQPAMQDTAKTGSGL